MRSLECELSFDGDTYFRISRKWYKTNAEYVAEINEEFSAIPRLDPKYLGAWAEKDGKYVIEDDFLKAQVSADMLLAHTKKIDNIEVADLLDTQNGYLVHVKRGRGAFLRNLFAQGFVSASLLHGSEDFRARSEEKFGVPGLENYSVVLAVFPLGVTEIDRIFTLFAKVDLVERYDALRQMGFEVSYVVIQ